MIKKLSKKGFSLVELLVVITIIAILSVVAYTALGGQTAKARNSRRAQDIGTIQSALEIFYIENQNNYPAVLDDGAPAFLTDLVPKYMPKMPKDPSSTDAKPLPYKYVVSDNKKEYQLAATFETEDSPAFEKAYLVGNAITTTMSGNKTPSGTAACSGVDTVVKDGSITCVPYNFQ